MRKISYRGYEFLIDEEFVQWGDIWWGEYEKGNWDPYLFDMMDRFLNKKISFSNIPRIVEKVMRRHARIASPNLQQIMCVDSWARQEALALAG